MSILSLGSIEKRHLVDNKGVDRMLHSLESVNFLKVDKGNYIVFECANGDERQISIQQEYFKGKGGENEDAGFWNLYKVNLHKLTLRELLLF